eukprot:scaffold62345_cov76-Attheya_sp.AAC.1
MMNTHVINPYLKSADVNNVGHGGGGSDGGDGNVSGGDSNSADENDFQTPTKAPPTPKTGRPVFAASVPPALRSIHPMFGGVPAIVGAVKLDDDCMNWSLNKLLVESVKHNIDIMAVSN